jgi:CheY-like chemotaxis protein
MSRPLALLVEDEGVMLLQAERQLDALGFEAIGVERASDAIALLEKPLAFVVVVTDDGLPDLDGYGVWETVGRLRPGLPVVFMTTDSVRYPLPAGAHAVRKPFTIWGLRDALTAAGVRPPAYPR